MWDDRGERGEGEGETERFLRRRGPEIRRRASGPPLGAITKVVGGLLAAAVMLAAGGHVLLSHPRLAVRAVAFEGVDRTSPELLATIAAEIRGRSTLRVDLGAIERRLTGSSPWVLAANVRRALPGRIEVEVVEHAPLARLGDGSALIAAGGGLLPALPARPGDAALPLVDLPAPPAPAIARTRSVELLELLGRGLLPLAPRIQSIDATNPEDLILRLVDRPWAVHLGGGEFVARLNRFRNVEPVLQTRYDGLTTVDLRFRDRVVVAPVAPVPPTSSGTSGG